MTVTTESGGRQNAFPNDPTSIRLKIVTGCVNTFIMA